MHGKRWFFTGDVAVMHPDGYLEVGNQGQVKRCNHQWRGNLSSVEVESVLYTDPAVNEAAVVAQPDEFWGKTPCAFVSLKLDVKQKPGEKDLITGVNCPNIWCLKQWCSRKNFPRLQPGKSRNLCSEKWLKI